MFLKQAVNYGSVFLFMLFCYFCLILANVVIPYQGEMP